MGYIFTVGPTAFSWRHSKQTLTATSSNHSGIITLYEASRECIWLRHLIKHIAKLTGKPTVITPTIIFENNRLCVQQVTTGFIKGDKKNT
jgi:hypothetical protein